MSPMLNAFVPALGWSLLHFVWQGLLIGWAASLALQLLRNRSPQLRYAVACGALLLCAALPLMGTASRLADAAGLAAVSDSTLAAAGTAQGMLPAAGAIPAIAMPAITAGSPLASVLDADQRIALEYTVRRQLPWLVLLWAAGAALMTLRLSLGLQWVRARTLPSHYHADPAWQRRLDQLALRFGLRRTVRLGISDDALEGPMTAGILRPIVLLPASLLSGLPPELLEALLAHELAHIKRHDYLANLAQSAIEIFLFFHPSVWMLSQRIRLEREQIADDVAASTLGEPRRLALALSELDKFQFSTTHFAAPAAHGGDLMSRIKRLVRPDAQPLSWKMATPLLGIFAACAALYAHAMPMADSAAATEVAIEAVAPADAAGSGQWDAPPASPPAPPAPPAKLPKVPKAPPMNVAVAPVPPAAPAAPAAPVSEPAPPALPALPALKAPPAPKALPPVPAVPAKPAADEDSLRVDNLQIDDNSRSGYAIVRGGDRITSMHGSRADWAALRKLKESTKGDYIWVRRDGKGYLIQDPAVLAKASEAWKPAEAHEKTMEAQEKVMEAHGAEMERLGAELEKKMEAAMGDKAQRAETSALERKMEALGRQQERVGREMERLGSRMARADDAKRSELERQMDELGRKMEPLSAEMAKAAAELARSHAQLAAVNTSELQRKMTEASKPMHELGRKMGELGREQARLARDANKKVQALIDEAIKNGSARPVQP